jgi:hypothetical protein
MANESLLLLLWSKEEVCLPLQLAFLLWSSLSHPPSLQTVISTVFLTSLNHELLVFFALWQSLPAVSLVGPYPAPYFHLPCLAFRSILFPIQGGREEGGKEGRKGGREGGKEGRKGGREGCGADTTFFCFAPSLLTYFLEFLGVVVLTHPFPVMIFVDNHESSRKIIAEAVACTLYQEHPDLTGKKERKQERRWGGRRGSRSLPKHKTWGHLEGEADQLFLRGTKIVEQC